jgi:NAD(P)-dependent dehydrogenase (short-subunit alcohol dehydrogenase family)
VPPDRAQTSLITGATSGLGRRLAEELAGRGATVLVHGRDPARTTALASELPSARPYVADLASLAQVRALAEEVRRDNDRLDVLVNNAGLISHGRRPSQDGNELTLAVNYLAGFLLTILLVPLLRASAPARIVNVASIGQHPIDFDDVMLERGYDPMRAYAQSKLAQIMFTFELAERLAAQGEQGVTVNALHPATLMDTNMVRQGFRRAMTSVDEGADATLRLILDPQLEGVTGRYFNQTREADAHEQAYDPGARRRLWELSEGLTGVRAGDLIAGAHSHD